MSLNQENDAARRSIEPTLRALEEAWGRGEGSAWAAKCTPDVDFINLLGMYVKGGPAVAEIHERIFHGPYAGSTLKFDIEHVRRLADDQILAIVPGELQIPAGPVKGLVRTVATMLFMRVDGVWLLASFHNTKREATEPDHTRIMTDAVLRRGRSEGSEEHG